MLVEVQTQVQVVVQTRTLALVAALMQTRTQALALVAVLVQVAMKVLVAVLSLVQVEGIGRRRRSLLDAERLRGVGQEENTHIFSKFLNFVGWPVLRRE